MIDIEKTIKNIDSFINVCPNCRHKQYSYTRECEECRFSWLRYYNQLKGLPLDTKFNEVKN